MLSSSSLASEVPSLVLEDGGGLARKGFGHFLKIRVSESEVEDDEGARMGSYRVRSSVSWRH